MNKKEFTKLFRELQKIQLSLLYSTKLSSDLYTNCNLNNTSYISIYLFVLDINRNIANQTLYGIDILHSTDDEIYMQTTLEKIKSSTDDVHYHEFVNYGHFCFGHSMESHEFPELLQICKG